MSISMKKVLFALLLHSVVFAQQPVNRFLLVAGANDGGKGRITLRYAVSDAKAFANVMSDLGGIPKQQQVILSNPDAESMRQGFADLARKLQSPQYAKGRKEVIVYYSGHADEQGLRLGKDVMSWPEIRKRVDGISADVKIAVLDACGSGAITRIKGGVSRPAFLSDASTDMKGYAFLTSSSESESSQESDRLRGSFFTHALVSGMRGAADMSGDGKVTLGEAYQFAFNETLQNTQATSGGPQHPSRDMNLAGTGDVVMTDVRVYSAGLVLGSDIGGRVFIRDSQGHLVAELNKTKGRSVDIGLAPGKYEVQLAEEKLLVAENIPVTPGKRYQLEQTAFRTQKRETAVARGDVAEPEPVSTTAMQPFYIHTEGPSRGMLMSLLVTDAKGKFDGTQISLVTNIARKDNRGLQLSVGPNLAFSHLDGSQLSAVLNAARYTKGVQISSGGNIAESLEGVQIAAGTNLVLGRMQGMQIGVVDYLHRGGVGMQAGVITMTGDTLSGAQSGIVNIANTTTLAQGGVLNIAKSAGKVQAGVLNVTGHAEDLQAGVLNVGGDLGGWQIGVFNLAHRTGNRPVGIINVVGHSDKAPIGLVNIVGNGILEWSFMADETHSGSIVFRTGTPWFYTVFEGSRPLDRDDSNPRSFGMGRGTRFGMERIGWQLEYVFAHIQKPGNNEYQFGYNPDMQTSGYWHKLRFGSSFALQSWVGLNAGISINALSPDENDNYALAPGGDYHFHHDFGIGPDMRIWPGLYAGVTFGRL